ncbi:cardiolipin synthase [Halalkalibacterium ligniniphilum]|uniref:cardiolipin synthase n=1 Tax=Halalkalibacterium ligniniphilum TaxID=1134413 RepID=UPI000345374F|nr:cardiolipin synthase [Halalkalibacterium ligniniphilum]
MGWLIFFIILLVIFLWLKWDYHHGLSQQKAKAKRHIQNVRQGNVRLFVNGEQFFSSLYEDIQKAENHVHLLFYIFREDSLGNKFLHLLEEKSKKGVAVRLLVDRIGSGLSTKSITRLRKAGCQFAHAYLPSFPYFFFSLNRRNHRKISVIDGKIGYIGGYNIGKEYAGRDPKFGFWRDFHLRLVGDGVQDLQEQFIHDWQGATAKDLSSNESLFPSLQKGPHTLRIIPFNGMFLEETFLQLINQAEKQIMIGTPYYIPGKKLQQALVRAASQGVTVRILVPKKADHLLVKDAAFPYFEELVHQGVEVYFYKQGFFHGKAMVIDEKICHLGTANFDMRSLHINHEINCLMYDKACVDEVLQVLKHDIGISERLTLDDLETRSWFQRGKEQAATLISGLL